MKKTCILYLTIQICFLSGTFAALITVPSDFTTIQSAIDNSVSGDTVLVLPGTYYENLNMHGRDILLTSNFYTTLSYEDIENTIINGSLPADADTASTILIISGETNACIIQGFTITGGAGTKWLDEHGAGIYREGGGFLIQYASPTIRYNYITGNNVTSYTGVVSPGGGGIRAGDSNPLIYNNIITNNTATGYGGGVIFNYCDAVLLQNNVIAYNTGGEDFGGGGVITIGNPGQVTQIVNCTITRNDAPGTGGYAGRGGGVMVFGAEAQIMNSIIYGNTQIIGGQIYATGGIIQDVTYSDVEGGYEGAGNIDADPMFLDTALCFLLDPASACVDAGNPDMIYYDPEKDFDPDNAQYPSMGTITNDMGANGGPIRLQISDCPEVEPPVSITDISPIINVYPNPAHAYVTIALPDVISGARVVFYSFQGTAVYQEIITGMQKTISTEQLPSGIYLISVLSGNENIASGKLIIE